MKGFIYSILILIFSAGLTCGQSIEQYLTKASDKNYFIENKGQWDKNILFLGQSNGVKVWICTDELVFDFFRVELLPKHSKPNHPKDPVDSPIIDGHVVKMKIRLDDPADFSEQEIFTGEPLEQYNNYFIGHDSSRWASNVKLFPYVIIKNYIPGADLKLYYDDGKFRYDIIAQPGINPNNIVLTFDGQDELKTADQNKIILTTSLGDIIHSDLHIYQNHVGDISPVKSEFIKVSENSIGFNINNYDPGLPVIIDPIVYSTFIGGTSVDYGYDIEMDRNGLAVAGGVTNSNNFPTTSGAYRRTAYGNYDIYVTRINSGGTSLSFSTYLGGSSNDYLYGLTLDNNGNVYITGYSNSTNYPVSSGSFQSYSSGNYDCIVTKLNAGGSAIVYSTYIGGWYIDYAYDIELDASNNAFICGTSSMLIIQTNYPTTSGAYSRNIQGGYDCFVTKLNSSGTSLIYSTFIGGSGTDYGYDLAIDASGNAFLTGFTQSSGYPSTTGCYQSSYRGSQDAFVTKFNSSGTSLLYSTFLGGTSTDNGTCIVIDGSGIAYITGVTTSTNFPSTTGAYRTTSYGGGDGYITKLNASGSSLVNSTYIGGSSSDQPTEIAIDQNYNLIITGSTASSNFPTSFCAFQTTLGSNPDVFVTAFNSSLSSLLYSSYFGGSGSDNAGGIVVNGLGEAYIDGYTGSSNFPTSSGVYDRSFNSGTYDAFVMKLPYISLGINGIIDATYCAGNTFSLPFIAGCTFNTGNVFTAQLSSSTGSFSSPVSLGSVTRQTSGNISCKIPQNASPGSGYRIRIVSTSPAFTSLDNGFNIIINPNPVSQFTINKDTQCLNINDFQFTNTSTQSSGGFSSLWQFGDTKTSNQTHPNHTYTLDSSFNVKLICISDSGCRDTSAKMVLVMTTSNTDFDIDDSIQCFNYNWFSFNSLTSIRKGSYSILWQFGDGDTTSAANPKHSYKASNNFNVILIATADNGCLDSSVKKIRILPSPQSSFTINDSAQCLTNNNFIFTNNTSILSGSMTYLWQFGDGNTSASKNPAHVYANPSNYTVFLISTSDSGCVDSASRTISLAPLPVAGFTVNKSPQCLKGNLFSFTNSSTVSKGNMTYLWAFGDGITDTLKNPAHSYLSDGTYTVKLITYTSTECTDTVESQITVRPSPVTSFSVNDTDQCFNQNNFVFTNSSAIKSGTLTHIWDFGDGVTDASLNTAHRYNADKNFTVKLISTSDLGCKDSMRKTMVVYSSPVANYFVTDTAMCLDRNIFSFSNNSVINTGTMRYLWSFGDSKTDTNRSISHVYSVYGDYAAMLISTSDKGCSDTFEKIIHVYPMPVAGFTVNNPVQCFRGNYFVCSNSSSIPSGSMTYDWNFGDGVKSTLASPDHSYPNAKKYDIMLISTSLFGCSDTFTVPVTVNLMPLAEYAVSTVCLDQQADFTELSMINPPDSIVQYLWDFGDGSVSTDRNPGYTYTVPGSYAAMLTVVSNNGCRDSIRKVFYLGPHVSAPVLDRVSVRYDAKDIEIEWTAPKTGFASNYVLEKSADNISYQPLSYPGKYNDGYLDASVTPDTMSYYYRIKAIDSCNYSSPYSNIGKSILLKTTNIDHIAEIKWSAYEQWPEGVNRYDIEVYNKNIYDFVSVGSVDGNTLEYNDDNTALNQSEYCYRVTAVRNGIETKAYSNADCVPINFGCYLPNAFTPNGDGLNDVLIAMGTSVYTFDLQIYDRWGRKVFQTSDINVGWDGKYNGILQPDGYYYFQMSARGVKNYKVIRKGTVLLARLKAP